MYACMFIFKVIICICIVETTAGDDNELFHNNIKWLSLFAFT
jgi:hypothetical protein